MSNEAKPPSPTVSLRSLLGSRSPEEYAAWQERLIKEYGSLKNYQEFKELAREMGHQENRIDALKKKVAELKLQNEALLGEWVEGTKQLN
jgi:hypothetical protein